VSFERSGCFGSSGERGRRWMIRFSRRIVMGSSLFERNLALAAIATAAAALAEMVIAGVRGAEGADLRALLLADAARKRH